MTTLDSAKTYGLVAQNSTAYVQEAFDRISSGSVVVPLHSKHDQHRIDVAGVDEVLEVDGSAGWMTPRFTPKRENSVAQVLFTSGTEGEPKGVVLTHDNLADVIDRLNSVMQVTSEIREYVGVPVYHSFGFGRCRAVATAGGKLYLPASGFNPLEIAKLLEAGEINAISAVPSLWRVLLEAKVVSAAAGAKVRWIEIGSQYMSRDEKLALRKLFPNAKIVQHYGLTEASRTTFLEVHSADPEALESVGRAYGQVEVAIGDDGRIRIRGPHVTHRILRKGQQQDPRDADGWLTTSDLGELRGDHLFYKGRADDVINCGGLKLPPDRLEADMRARLDQPGDFTLCRVPDPVRGDGILIAATHALQASNEQLMEAAVAAAAEFNVNARGATHVFRVESLPRTATGKVQRKELASQYQATRPEPAAQDPGEAEDDEDLRRGLGRVLGISSIPDDANFQDLGGDSLRFIQASMLIQKNLGYLPDGWERLSVAELEALPKKSGNLVSLEASVLARTLGITSIVVNHSLILQGLLVIDGAAFMLFIPTGFSFARFQLQRILHQGGAYHALSTLPAIIIPTFLLCLLHQLKGGEIYPAILLFYNNYVDHYADGGFNFWFLEVFVQLHLIFFVLCAIPQFRGWVRKAPYTLSLALFGLGFALSQIIPLFWNTDHLYNLVPHRFIPYFALGWCVFFAREKWQRLVNSGLVLFLAAWQLPKTSETVWILVGGMLLTWSPSLRLPTVLATALGVLASASLYVYLTHAIFLNAAMRLPLPYMEFLQIPVAMVAGVIVGLGIDWVRSKSARLLKLNRA